jgi:hypothetical protein
MVRVTHQLADLQLLGINVSPDLGLNLQMHAFPAAALVIGKNDGRAYQWTEVKQMSCSGPE